MIPPSYLFRNVYESRFGAVELLRDSGGRRKPVLWTAPPRR